MFEMDTDSDTEYWTSDDQENPQDAQSTDESESDFEDDVDDLENNDELIRLRRERTTLDREIFHLGEENERRRQANAPLMRRKDELIRDNGALTIQLRERGMELAPPVIRVDPIHSNTTRIREDIQAYNDLLSRYPDPPPQSGETPNPDIVETRDIIQENIGML